MLAAMDEDTFPSGPPADISRLVRERAEARAGREWTKADAIKAQIEAAGWRVVDRGRRSSVRRAAPESVDVDGERRYGSATNVPSALDSPPTTEWTVIVPASEEPDRVSRLLAALRAHAPAGIHVVVVANDPSAAQAAALARGAPDRAPIGGREIEVLRTSVRLGYAAALNVALRRASGRYVLLTDGSAAPAGDAFTPLEEALADPHVAVAGAFGLAGDDEGGPFRPGSLGRLDSPADHVAAVEGAWLATRRDDLIALGPLDEHFVTPAWLDVWLSLRLRCGDDGLAESDPEEREADESMSGERDGVEGGEAETDRESAEVEADPTDEPAEADLPPPGRALSVSLPLERPVTAWPPDRSRLNRRNMYRVLRRFGWRDDLA
jgi:hypothetical protein